jgi:hypothetical protein
MRLAEALHLVHASAEKAGDDCDDLLISPIRLRTQLERTLGEQSGRIRVTGTLDRRLVFVERLDGRWIVADLSGLPHASRQWPAWTVGRITLEDPASWVSLAILDEEAAFRLSRPRVLLAALYHLEYFPLPRFPLGISDVARAARSTLLGETTLADMQLGTTLEDLAAQVAGRTPDILGVSATFGQHDLMSRSRRS